MTAAIAARAGVGLKPAHYRVILDSKPAVGFFEAHAENYMGAGGPPHRYLEAVRAHYPLSLHAVGLSIGAARRLDRGHLRRLAALVDRYQPALVSEHLAWSVHEDGCFNDLLPLPYTEETLALVCEHVDEVQEMLGRRVLLENPATYVRFAHTTIPETEFLAAVAARTGCGLLLDVNNVHVCAVNHDFDPIAFLEALPVGPVEQMHLAGFAEDCDDAGHRLLIDDHGSAVDGAVWALYAHALRRFGPLPTLIEWDNALPAWPVLLAEAERAELHLRTAQAGRIPQVCEHAALAV